MFRKCSELLTAGIFWFIFGFMVIAVPLTVISTFVAVEGRYLESATYYHGRPTSRAFYESFVANGHYKTLAVYIGLLSLVGGIIFAFLSVWSRRQKTSRDNDV